MTTCDHTRNRLLTLPDPAAPSAVVLAHLAECAACREYQSRLLVLDADLLALPAPASDAAKAAFLDTLTAAGPVIRTRPMLPAGRSLKDVLARYARPSVGVAAAVLVGVGVWRPWQGNATVAVEADAPRHELAKRVVAANAELARTADEKRRVVTLAALAADVGDEARELVLAANEDEMRTLAAMFTNLVDNGVLEQAKRINKFDPPAERLAALRTARASLARVTTELGKVPPTAAARPAVEKMSKTAADAQAALARLEQGG